MNDRRNPSSQKTSDVKQADESGKGLDLIQAAALALVAMTGNQLLLAMGIKVGQTVLVVGAAGKCRPFGSIHWEGVWGGCDRGGFEEAVR